MGNLTFFETILKLFWNYFETILKLFWDYFETILRLFCDYFETILRLFWNYFETILRIPFRAEIFNTVDSPYYKNKNIYRVIDVLCVIFWLSFPHFQMLPKKPGSLAPWFLGSWWCFSDSGDHCIPPACLSYHMPHISWHKVEKSVTNYIQSWPKVFAYSYKGSTGHNSLQNSEENKLDLAWSGSQWYFTGKGLKVWDFPLI